MPYVIGVGLAFLTFLLGRLSGFDRDRAFYPTLLIVIASYYVLFAALGGSIDVLVRESIATTLFTLIAIAGFRVNLWLVAGALAAHGLFDLIHGSLILDPGIPPWWPAFCLAYDIALAACMAWLLQRRSVSATTIGRSLHEPV